MNDQETLSAERGADSGAAPCSEAKCEWWSGNKKSGFTTCQNVAAWQHVKHTSKGEQVWKLCEHHKRLLLDSYSTARRSKEEPEWTPVLPPNDQAHRSAPGVTVERKGNDGKT